MRIAYIFNSSLPSYNPGSLQVIKTCEGIIKNGHKVTLITPNTGLQLSVKKFYDLKKIPKIIRLKFFNKFPLGLNYYLFSILAVLSILKHKYDVFITRNIFTLIVLVLFKKKVIIEIHHDFSIESRIVNFLIYNFNFLNNKNVIKIIAITKPVKNFLLKNFEIAKSKIEIVPSASNIRVNFQNLKKKKRFNIGYFGSLEKGKGADFVGALSKLDNYNNYFIYGGTFEKMEKFEKKFKNKNLKLSSYIPYEKIKKIISKMDILLLPTNTKIIKASGGVGNLAKFTSPLKLFDYLASGKLIICSNLNVLNEIINNGKNCIVIKNLKKLNWLKEIQSVNKNLYRINKIKKNAHETSKKYTYFNRARMILNNLKF